MKQDVDARDKRGHDGLRGLYDVLSGAKSITWSMRGEIMGFQLVKPSWRCYGDLLLEREPPPQNLT
jgi:hypothetical protein